jgi:hypothetical protein
MQQIHIWLQQNPKIVQPFGHTHVAKKEQSMQQTLNLFVEKCKNCCHSCVLISPNITGTCLAHLEREKTLCSIR